MPEKILVVDDEVKVCDFLSEVLSQEGYQPETADSGRKALELLRQKGFDLLITDLMMPEMDGLRLLELAREEDPDLAVLVITGYSTVETAVEAMKKGAFDYLPKPFKIDQIKVIIDKALKQRRLMEENRRLRQELKETRPRLVQIIGDSPAMQQVYRLVEKVAKTGSTVLIRGENGTGKELIARALHRYSDRSQRSFVSINCAALPENLLESELFGHTRGAFTGAVAAKKGLFEEADGGTIFLDEIGDISPAMQVKLLRVLQEHEFIRVGETRPRQVDVRVLAATNRDLERAMAEGGFRPELFYRLNVITVTLPPLRRREGDIPLLANHFLSKYRQKTGRGVASISREALRLLSAYPWPGNVRELENVIERAVILCDGSEITPADLPKELQDGWTRKDGTGPIEAGMSFKEAVSHFQRELILKALAESGGVQARAAELLGLKRTTLNEIMKRLDVQ